MSYLEPKSIEAQTAVARIVLAQKDYLGAIVEYEDLIALDPQNADAYYNIGIAFKARGRQDEAIKAFNKAKELYQRQGNNSGVENVDKLLKEL